MAVSAPCIAIGLEQMPIYWEIVSQQLQKELAGTREFEETPKMVAETAVTKVGQHCGQWHWAQCFEAVSGQQAQVQTWQLLRSPFHCRPWTSVHERLPCSQRQELSYRI